MISDYPILRLVLFLGLLLGMFTLEGFKPQRSWTELRKNRFWFSIRLAVVNNIVMKLLVSVPFVWWAEYVADQGWGLSQWLGITGLANILVTIVLFDFLDAIKHLMFHRVRLMWRFHRAHHTDTHLDIFTALRYHPGEFIISAIFKAGWIVFWGPSMLAFLCFEILLNMASQFHHANIRLPEQLDRALSKLIVTPRYHAMHHTINRDQGDQNFTTIFSIWDRVLGTFCCPFKNPVDLERLGNLQSHHLSVINLLKSPLRPDPQLPDLSSDLLRKKQFSTISSEIATGKALLLDVREQAECQKTGYIHRSISLPWSKILSEKTHLDGFKGDDKTVYVYCAAGVRASKAAQILMTKRVRAQAIGGFDDCINYGLKRGLPDNLESVSQH